MYFQCGLSALIGSNVAWNEAAFASPPDVIDVPVSSAPTTGDDASWKSGFRSHTHVACRSPVRTTGFDVRPEPKNSSSRLRCTR